MKQKKIIFIDRDGTLIDEPADYQVDQIEKLKLKPDVIPSLLKLKKAGYALVIITNQDGLGTDSFPENNFRIPQQFMLDIFSSQGIQFEAIRICPHHQRDGCNCRKPKTGLIEDYLVKQIINHNDSYVIGDRETDIEFANNIRVKGIRFGQKGVENWPIITRIILNQARKSKVSRCTNETIITTDVNLDENDLINIQTGIGFFDHMLEQLAKHGGFTLSLVVKGDLHIDEHHTVEDVAITLGEAIKNALGDKFGIDRYGFLLPMDEALATVAIDLSGRSYFAFKGKFTRDSVGGLSTELVPHFFRSFAHALKAALHIEIKGENNHHMIEAIFKCVGRVLKQAIRRTEENVPSTKGVL